jgi:hypothetical protein
VIGQETEQRLPRSYKEGRLLRLLAGDLPGHWVEQSSPGRARFVPVNGGPVIDVRERVDRRFLGHNEIAQFQSSAPATSPGPAHLRIRHTGRLKRDGVEVTVTDGDESVRALARAIEADVPFVAAVLPLDFTRFEIRRRDRGWLCTVELMGASYVSLALPPMRTYVRLHTDQREALVDSFSAVIAVIRRLG